MNSKTERVSLFHSKKRQFFSVWTAFILIFVLSNMPGCDRFTNDDNNDNHIEELRIQPYPANPWYWQYKGEPVLLIGGSDQDNLFNHPNIPPAGLEAHLDRLISAAGNGDGSSQVAFYVRNTMSSRDEGPNVWWYHQDPETGLYDMDRFNEEYWERFENFLQLTAERDIIVQIELWDRFDYAREPWDLNPFNPENNINYTAEESSLPVKIETHPGERENPFFRSVPELEDNGLVRQYQKAIVSKLMEISLRYGHVLYCISNETNESPLWGEYWARFLRKKAEHAGRGIEVTEMWGARDLMDEVHRYTFDHPDLYSFVDISQNSHQRGQLHWDNMQKARETLAVQPRPLNSVKIYGGTRHGHSPMESTNRLWQNMFGGLASSRFHRPGHVPGYAGAGLSDLAVIHLRSAYMFLNEFDVFSAEPANNLLDYRKENEAYCMAISGSTYAVFFPAGGSVILDLSNGGSLNVPDGGSPYTIRWFNIMESSWNEPTVEVFTEGQLLTTPDEGQWAVLIQAADEN